jgi:hypothetical protein
VTKELEVMGFSIPMRAGLPETSHIMWTVFMIGFQSSPFLGRVPKNPLPNHYHVSWIKKRELRKCQSFL